MMDKLEIAGYLPAKHLANCAVYDPTPDTCDCGANRRRGIPLVRLDAAQELIDERDRMIEQMKAEIRDAVKTTLEMAAKVCEARGNTYEDWVTINAKNEHRKTSAAIRALMKDIK